MNKKDYNLIAMSIWRSGYIKDKNEIRRKAKNNMRMLIANDLIGSLNKNSNFNSMKFLKACGLVTSII